MFTRKRLEGHSIASFTLVAAVFFKWYVTQGSAFNSQLFDDENQWKSDIVGRSSAEYLFLRDLPGYFVIPMRFVLLFIDQVGLSPEISVRLFVTITQVLCFWILVQVLFRYDFKIKLLTFVTLTLIPLEDLNYLHNVGYLFALVITSAWIQSFRVSRRLQIVLALICGFLIVKPLVALILLSSILIDVAFFRRSQESKKITRFELVFSLICICYLVTYFLLPNDFDSPESISLVAIAKALFNLSWIYSSILLPLFNFGLIGFLRLEYGREIANSSGALIWSLATLTSFFVFYKYRSTIFSSRHLLNWTQRSSSLKRLTLVTCVTYLSVYTVTNFAWVAIWPLWELAYSPRLWMRWASNVPILFTSAVVLLLVNRNRKKMAAYLLISLIVQYSLLWIFARDVLIRWQG